MTATVPLRPAHDRPGPAPAPARPGRRRRGLPRGPLHPATWAPTALVVLVLAVGWSAVAAEHPYILPRLSDVGLALADRPEVFLSNAWSTLSIALVGVACGAGVAFALALVMSEVPVVRRALMPLAVVLNVTPVVALAPGLVVAFGFGMAPKVIVTAIITFFPVLINVTTGLRAVPEPVLHVFQTLHASRAEVLWRLRIPYGLPYTLAALRVTMPLSIVGAVVAEFVAAGSNGGLGTLISTSASAARLDSVYAAIACLATLGVLMLALVSAVERRALFWHESQRTHASRPRRSHTAQRTEEPPR